MGKLLSGASSLAPRSEAKEVREKRGREREEEGGERRKGEGGGKRDSSQVTFLRGSITR